MRKATPGAKARFSYLDISIPAFREEGDALVRVTPSKRPLFQSPPSVRKATGVTDSMIGICDLISIPAFREEGDTLVLDESSIIQNISIPAFREEGDCGGTKAALTLWISIPAFREEGDTGRITL